MSCDHTATYRTIMRKELYESLKERLLSRLKEVNGERMVLMSDAEAELYADRESVVKHVDLWNQNVVFVEQDEPWERPAVFVEFAPIEWKAVQSGVEWTTRSRVILHVVTDWKGADVFELPNLLHELLEDFGGAVFGHLHLVESQTNHNHEELVESIEIYEYRGWKSL